MQRLRAGHFARLAEQRDVHVLFRARNHILDRDLLRLLGKIRHAQTLVEERIVLDVDSQGQVVLQRVADLDQPIRQPISQTVSIEHGHGDIHVGLVLDQPLASVLGRAIANALERRRRSAFRTFGQRDEVLGVHLERVGMAGEAQQLLPRLGNLAVHGRGPVTLRRLTDYHHGPAIFSVPLLHGLERGDDLVIVVAILDGEDVPSIGGPLVDQACTLRTSSRSRRR